MYDRIWERAYHNSREFMAFIGYTGLEVDYEPVLRKLAELEARCIFAHEVL